MRRLKLVAALFAIVSTLFLLLRVPLSAESLPHFALRELVCMADQIVLCEPLEDEKIVDERRSQYVAFKVIEALSGPELKAGTVLRFSHATGFSLSGPYRMKQPVPKLTQAILFLRAPDGIFPDHYGGGMRPRPASPDLFWSSQRYLGDDNKVYAPHQMGNPGNYELQEVKDASWEKLLVRLKEDIKAAGDVKALFKIENAAERNKALFDWIEKHKHEFKPNGYFGRGARSDLEASPGWSVLQALSIRWIAESGIPEDAWKALLLLHDVGLGPDDAPGAQPQAGSFSTKAGRQFLMSHACDAALPEWQRILALSHLDGPALRPSNNPKQLPFEALTDDERALIFARISTPLQDKVPEARGLAAKIMQRLIAGKYSGDRVEKFDAQIKALLTEAYAKEAPGDARRHMAELFYKICDDAEWKALTGSSNKRFAYFRTASTRPGGAVQVHLHFEKTYPDQMPTLLLEHLAQDGSVLNTISPDISNIREAVQEGEGWLYQIMLSAKNNFEPGTYRIHCEGSDGELKWRSEAAEIVVTAPPQIPK